MMLSLITSVFVVVLRVAARPTNSHWAPREVAEARVTGQRGALDGPVLARCTRCLRPTLDALQEAQLDVLEAFPEMCLCAPTRRSVPEQSNVQGEAPLGNRAS